MILNVRYDRVTLYNIIRKLKKGDTAKLNYCLNGWVSIEGYKGNKGLGYKNRGVKKRTDLGFLKNTKAPALLVECCFVDDKDYIDLYNSKSMSKAIAQGILNKKISTQVPTPTPIHDSEVFYRAVSGSFNNKNNALDRRSKLDKDRFSSVFLDAFVKDETTWYRVIAGSFKDKKLAERRIEDLYKKVYGGGFITSFRK